MAFILLVFLCFKNITHRLHSDTPPLPTHTHTPPLQLVCLELGGKSAHIVFADCDLEAAAPNVLMGFTTNSGQCCCAGTRVLVQEAVCVVMCFWRGVGANAGGDGLYGEVCGVVVMIMITDDRIPTSERCFVVNTFRHSGTQPTP